MWGQRALMVVVLLGGLAACASPPPPPPPAPTPPPAPPPNLFTQTGEASWYGGAHQGRTTASGEKFDRNALTAAHRSLPMGVTVQVTNLGNGRVVQVRITDRGPYNRKRIIDVSEAAAKLLDFYKEGTATVRIETELPPDVVVAPDS